MSVKQADLGLPGAVAGWRSLGGPAGGVAVVPGGSTNSRPACRLPLLVMRPRCCCSPEEYALGVTPSQDASSRGCTKRAKSPISAISPSAVRVEIPRNAVSLSTCQPQRYWWTICSRRASSVASWRSIPSRWISICSSAACASGSARRWRATHARCVSGVDCAHCGSSAGRWNDDVLDVRHVTPGDHGGLL